MRMNVMDKYLAFLMSAATANISMTAETRGANKIHIFLRCKRFLLCMKKLTISTY